MYFRSVKVGDTKYEVIGMDNEIEVKGLGKFKISRNRFSARNKEVLAFIEKKIKNNGE